MKQKKSFVKNVFIGDSLKLIGAIVFIALFIAAEIAPENLTHLLF